jgi:hypothetical protein
MYQIWINDHSKMDQRNSDIPLASRAGAGRRFLALRGGRNMMPLEFSWPPEMLAQVFPDKYRHLTQQAHAKPFNRTAERQSELNRYTVERLIGGCVVYWLGGRESGRPA